MDPWLIALIIAGISVIAHGIFTGMALAATWYFGRLAEIKLLKEAQEIHAEVTAYIEEMKKADQEYDRIAEFMEQQKQVLSGFRSEIGRVSGEELQKAVNEIRQIASQYQPGSAPGQPSALDKVLAVAAQFAGAGGE